jgi:hypothetical protein
MYTITHTHWRNSWTCICSSQPDAFRQRFYYLLYPLRALVCVEKKSISSRVYGCVYHRKIDNVMFADEGGRKERQPVYIIRSILFFRAQHSYSDGRKRNDRDACQIVFWVFSSITILSTSNTRDKKVGVSPSC